MAITNARLDHLCKLSSLNLSNEQKVKFGSQLDSIVELVSKLDSLDLTDALMSSYDIVGHTNTGVDQIDFNFSGNIRHPIIGQLPAISFSTR